METSDDHISLSYHLLTTSSKARTADKKELTKNLDKMKLQGV